MQTIIKKQGLRPEQNGRLKDTPTAIEVSKTGVDLGEMDTTLLQKMEELMPCTIQQQKEMEKLGKEVVELKKDSK